MLSTKTRIFMPALYRVLRFSLGAACALALCACSTPVKYEAAQLTPPAQQSPLQLKTLANGATVTFHTGYERQLKAGSQWAYAGQVSQGEIYRPHNDVFTVEGAHIHEAHLVVSQDSLVGFYLPYERGFSALPQPLKLTFK